MPDKLLEVQLPGHRAAVLPPDLIDRWFAGHGLLSWVGSRLFATSNSFWYFRILVIPHIQVVRPTAWFGQEPDVVHFLSKSIPVVMSPFSLRAASTGQITRVHIQAGFTASRDRASLLQCRRPGPCCITMWYWLSSSSQRANWAWRHLKLNNHIKL